VCGIGIDEIEKGEKMGEMRSKRLE